MPLYNSLSDYKKVLDKFDKETNLKLQKVFTDVYNNAYELAQQQVMGNDEKTQFNQYLNEMDCYIYFMAVVYGTHMLSVDEIKFFGKLQFNQSIMNIVDYFGWFGIKDRYDYILINYAIKAGANEFITKSPFWDSKCLREIVRDDLTLAQAIMWWGIKHGNTKIIKELGTFIEGYWEECFIEEKGMDNRVNLFAIVVRERAIECIQDQELFPLSFWDGTSISAFKTNRHYAMSYILQALQKNLPDSKKMFNALLNLFEQHETNQNGSNFKLNEFLTSYEKTEYAQYFVNNYSLICDQLELCTPKLIHQNTMDRVQSYLKSINRDLKDESLLVWITLALKQWQKETTVLMEKVGYDEVIRIGDERVYYTQGELKQMMLVPKKCESVYRKEIYSQIIFSGLNESDLKNVIDTALQMYDEKNKEINTRHRLSEKRNIYAFFNKDEKVSQINEVDTMITHLNFSSTASL